MADDDVPLLRADATDDDLGQDDPRVLKGVKFAKGGPFGPNPGDNATISESTESIPDSEDAEPGDGGTVDPASPGATSANGVIHGGL